jgi:protein involved in plasmid replication-relaxation
MPNVRGVVLTDRDRALLAYVGIARYASADQVHRLIAPEHSKKLVYRRLAKLCQPGGRPGEGACLRRLHYRRYEGTSVPVWALTPYGRSLVAPVIPWLPSPPASDVGARFLEHTLLLNDVLLKLVLMFRRSPEAPLGALPFRWLAEGDQVLEFRHGVLDRHAEGQGVLKPDAILEIVDRGLRVFVEAETGTQSIVTAHPERTGAIVAKLRRYSAFLLGRTENIEQTWYLKAFPDGFGPRLLFLAHSAERRERVWKAIKEAMGSGDARWVLVHTFAEAAELLLGYLPKPVTPPASLATPGTAQLAAPAPSLAPQATGASPAPGPASAPAAPPQPAPAFSLDRPQLDHVRQVFAQMASTVVDIEDALVLHRRAKGCAVDAPRIPREQMDFLAAVLLWDKKNKVRWPAPEAKASR